MFKIDMINVMGKLLKIVHSMEHSRSQLKTYISKISVTTGGLFWSCFVNGLSLCCLVLVLDFSTNTSLVQSSLIESSSSVVIVRL